MLSKQVEGDKLFETPTSSRYIYRSEGLYCVTEFDEGGAETGGQIFETLDGAIDYVKEVENSLLEESSMDDLEDGIEVYRRYYD